MIVSTSTPSGFGSSSGTFRMESHVQTTVEYTVLCEKGQNKVDCHTTLAFLHVFSLKPFFFSKKVPSFIHYALQ